MVDGATHEVTTVYGTANQVLWRSYPDGDGAGSAGQPFVYDQAGRLKSLPGVISNMTYTARGQASVVSYANGVAAQPQGAG